MEWETSVAHGDTCAITTVCVDRMDDNSLKNQKKKRSNKKRTKRREKKREEEK